MENKKETYDRRCPYYKLVDDEFGTSYVAYHLCTIKKELD